jgi:hypothetical protein
MHSKIESERAKTMGRKVSPILMHTTGKSI